jgi:hypothetical protein
MSIDILIIGFDVIRLMSIDILIIGFDVIRLMSIYGGAYYTSSG